MSWLIQSEDQLRLNFDKKLSFPFHAMARAVDIEPALPFAFLNQLSEHQGIAFQIEVASPKSPV
jgi:hypothetical protein